MLSLLPYLLIHFSGSSAEEMSVPSIVRLEQTYSNFISDYESAPSAKRKSLMALQAMRSHLADFRLAILGQRPASLGPCGAHIVKKNQNKFFRCMEKQYPDDINEASFAADLKIIQKIAEKLIAQ